jgi:hypothetical protein
MSPPEAIIPALNYDPLAESDAPTFPEKNQRRKGATIWVCCFITYLFIGGDLIGVQFVKRLQR